MSGSTTLNVIKENLGASEYARANPNPIYGNMYIKVNINASKDFFACDLTTLLLTCIHELSHFGGSGDYLDGHGAAVPKWDNAHLIEWRGVYGLKAFREIVDLTKCVCE